VEPAPPELDRLPVTVSIMAPPGTPVAIFINGDQLRYP
jgi:hypothetical protein